MALKVCKFGGSSLADASQIQKAVNIIQSDSSKRYIVPSAPGKRHKEDQKITDLLYLCHEHAKQGLPFDDVYHIIADRYLQIASDLNIHLDVTPLLSDIKRQIIRIAESGGPADYAASRGEYLNAHIIADSLGCPIFDAAEMIYFDKRGRLDEQKTYDSVSESLSDTPQAVIPGFYGQDINGQVKTFSRGGSDVTGAIIARGVKADLYENWTDVSGLLMADPRIVDQPKTIDTITYRELRELSYMGATVLHDEAVFPVRGAGIPVNIRNTNDPEAPGTTIVSEGSDKPLSQTAYAITGIAGRRDFTVINVEKAMMNTEIGFGRRLLHVLEVNGISFEHMPSGIDTMSVVIADSQLEGKLDGVLEEIRQECHPDAIDIDPDMAVIATVGRGMSRMPGMAARLFSALAMANINIRMIDQGSSELNIIIGINAHDFEKAVQAIYTAFVPSH